MQIRSWLSFLLTRNSQGSFSGENEGDWKVSKVLILIFTNWVCLFSLYFLVVIENNKSYL